MKHSGKFLEKYNADSRELWTDRLLHQSPKLKKNVEIRDKSVLDDTSISLTPIMALLAWPLDHEMICIDVGRDLAASDLAAEPSFWFGLGCSDRNLCSDQLDMVPASSDVQLS